jgi:NodT family efflux transporter outer membrane factor (OMF) lipoprotein
LITHNDIKSCLNCFFIIVLLTVSAVLTGCTVGPDFHRPDAPETDTYTSSELKEKTVAAPVEGGEAQHFVSGQDIPSEWWTLFHSEALDQLIRDALSGNPSLAAARAALLEAYENVPAGIGSKLYPQIDANLSAERQKFSGASFGQAFGTSFFNLFNASVSVSYALDLFGSTRRELEALESQVDYQFFQLEGAYLTLTSNIVTTAVKAASLHAQIKALQDVIVSEEKQLDIVERQFQIGAVSLSDVLSQRAQLAQTRTELPPLEKELEQTHHQLAVLTGRLPSEGPDLPQVELEGLSLPEELPVSLPSLLVRQRPDIRASEALLHAASAKVGVATANIYPQITLSGSYGSDAPKVNELFDKETEIWHIAAGLLQPVFHGGELTAKRRAALAAFDQATAKYRETVLLAFQNVADVLRALDADARTLKAQADAEEAARDTFDLTQKQFQLGAVSYLTLLNAERQYQQAQIGLIQARAARFADTAALFQALGGGWWNRVAQDETALITQEELKYGFENK